MGREMLRPSAIETTKATAADDATAAMATVLIRLNCCGSICAWVST
jgi:hypothetical protein